MFGIGMNEMMIILVIAVIIIGPRQIPEIARNLGKMMAQFKRATNELRTAVNDEISQQIEIDELKEIRQSLDSDLQKIGSEARSYVESGMEEERKLMDEVESEFQSAGTLDGKPLPKIAATGAKKKKPAKKATAKKAATSTGTIKATAGKSTATAKKGSAATSAGKGKSSTAGTKRVAKKPSAKTTKAGKAS